MFTSPPRLKADVFATLPVEFSRKGQPAAWLQLHKRGAAMGSFLEGPSFDDQGNLYVVDIPFGRVFRVDAAGNFAVVAEYDGQPNGLKFAPSGKAYIADHKRGLVELDVRRGAAEIVLDAQEHKFIGLNDLFFAEDICYITDQGQSGLHDPVGRVLRWHYKTGKLDCLMHGIPSPNGIVLDALESSVLVAVTRANAVWRLPLLLDGSTSKVGVFVQLSGGFGPDGMAVDVEGNLAVCHPGLGAVWLFSPFGEPILRVDSPVEPVVTNCAYGGPANEYLYITEANSGVILRAKMPFPGKKMAYPL